VDWILTIVLTSGLLVPIADFAKREDCEKALDMWTLEPGVRIVCLADDIRPKRHIKRRRYREDD
jgi:hypothetical protein